MFVKYPTLTCPKSPTRNTIHAKASGAWPLG